MSRTEENAHDDVAADQIAASIPDEEYYRWVSARVDAARAEIARGEFLTQEEIDADADRLRREILNRS